METVRVGGRKYSDPDVLSLIKETGRLVDPRSAVINQARQLCERFRDWGGQSNDSIQRLTILASLRGLEVQEMTMQGRVSEDRDAVLLPTSDGKRDRILYKPRRPRGRVAFSIAHEISHTLFPNSMNGARFRSICDSASREANELERLCDLGASELLMPHDDFLDALCDDIGLHRVEELMAKFGSSFESTVFRLATAHPRMAAAGLLRYRLRKDEERAASQPPQPGLFLRFLDERGNAPEKKYRRQSFFMSDSCTEKHTVRWNKSFDTESCVYIAGANPGVIYRRRETLPDLAIDGTLEAIHAPYQREGADPDHGDVLFFWHK